MKKTAIPPAVDEDNEDTAPSHRQWQKKYASSVDVARLAGVSQSAVSRTYMGKKVSEATRQRVLAAADQLDYRPSLIPQIMLTHKSYLVAIVVGGLYNPYYSIVLEQFTVKLHESGHQTLLVHVESDSALDEVIPRLASYRVDAIVSALSIFSLRAADALAQLKIPVISFNAAQTNEWVYSISSDNIGAGRQIADLFAAHGAQRFAFISGPSVSHASSDRLKGYVERSHELRAGQIRIAQGDYHYEGGFDATLRLFSGGTKPDALFCANDLLALGAMDALRHSLGIRVPQDVIVAGFDNIPATAWHSYNVTTFEQNSVAMVLEAVNIVVNAPGAKMLDERAPVVFAPSLIERLSTTKHL